MPGVRRSIGFGGEHQVLRLDKGPEILTEIFNLERIAVRLEYEELYEIVPACWDARDLKRSGNAAHGRLIEGESAKFHQAAGGQRLGKRGEAVRVRSGKTADAGLADKTERLPEGVRERHVPAGIPARRGLCHGRHHEPRAGGHFRHVAEQ